MAGASRLLINDQQAAELFDKLDLDGNGTLSLEELTDLDPKSPAGRAQTAFAGTEHKKRRSLLTSAELHTWRVRDSFTRESIRSPAPPTRGCDAYRGGPGADGLDCGCKNDIPSEQNARSSQLRV